MKKLISLILCLSMIISCLCGMGIISVSAKDAPEFGDAVTSIGAVSDLGVLDTANKPIKILMIGNSFSWNAFSFIKQIIQSSGRDVVCANLFYSGCSLAQHYDFIYNNRAVYSYESTWQSNKESYTITQALSDQNWDFISLQQVSGYAGRYDDSYQPYLHNIIEYLHQNAPNAEIVWHQTWAYQRTSDHVDFKYFDNDQDKMWAAIEASSKKAAEAEGIRFIIPSGKAFQNARATSIGDNLNLDGYHANDYGRYVAGLCFFCTLTGMMPSKSMFTPTSISTADADLLRQAVRDAVLEYGYTTYFDSSDNTYLRVLKKMQLYSRKEKLDGIIVAGNTITNSQADLNPFRYMCEDYIKDNNVMFTLGDKDYTLGSRTGFFFSSSLKEFCNNDLESSSQKKLCNRHITVDGYHIIGVSFDTLTDGFATYTDSAVEFLEAELQKARADAPGKPIFVVTSVPISNTAGSKGKSRLCNILEKYPEVIALSGNSSESISAESAVYQDRFTAVNVGTLSKDKGDAIEYMLIEVDETQRVRIRRFNLSKSKEYPAIIIGAPDIEGLGHLKKYTVGSFETPIITNPTDGASFDIDNDEAPVMTWFQDGEKATLNGEDCPYGTAVSEPGEYTLKVTSGDKSAEVKFTITTSKPAYKKGDFDFDGEITVADALAALRIAAKLVSEDDISILIGDIDADSHVTVADALAILRVAAKLTETL